MLCIGRRRTVSVHKTLVDNRLDQAYEAAHSTPNQGLRRMDHEYRRLPDPSALAAATPVYTQLQQNLYPELRF